MMRNGTTNAGGGLQCELEFNPPYAWSSLLAYLRLRAVPGVELADATHYRRTVAIDDHRGWLAIALAPSGVALDVELSPSLGAVSDEVLARLRHLFDLDVVPDVVAELLSRDPLLAATVHRLPGLRVAGAFDGFEIAVRAVLGQQVSVKGATTLAGRWAAGFGESIVTPFPALNRLAPAAQRMALVDENSISAHGIIGARSRCIIALARAVAERRVMLSQAANVDEQLASLMALPGIGPWTAHYIAMRALHWPDAFPGGDLMLQRAAGLNHRQLLERAENWRPWRAYATHYLWQSLGGVP